MSDKPEKIYAYPGSLIYALAPTRLTVEYIRADLAKPSENHAELQRLFDVVDQVIKNSQPIKHIGIVVKSPEAWQVLMDAWQYHKADGMTITTSTIS